jgi:P27 family predicted phage terminase small subunit
MGLDRRPDGMMLEGACYNYGGAIDAENIIGREGATVTESTIDEESGEVTVLRVKAHPAVQIARQRWTLVKGFCSEFGLSPVSRTRLTIEKKDTGEADLAAILSAPRVPRPPATVN